MLVVEKIDTRSTAQVRRFLNIPFRLYANCPQWVPPLWIDAEAQLNRKKHPFYEHSDADFYVAARDGRDVLHAYGWPHGISDQEILARLLEENLKREAAG